MRRLTAGFARCLALCLATWSFPGLAHDTGIAHDEPPGWTLDPWITVPLLLTLVLFGVGASRLSRRSGRGSAALARRVRFFVVGWLCSPSRWFRLCTRPVNVRLARICSSTKSSCLPLRRS
ncbi:hypothetical protein ACFSHP_15160 [Novosphingobium panipatense]